MCLFALYFEKDVIVTELGVGCQCGVKQSSHTTSNPRRRVDRKRKQILNETIQEAMNEGTCVSRSKEEGRGDRREERGQEGQMNDAADS